MTAITVSAVLAFRHQPCQKSICAALLLEAGGAYSGAALINNVAPKCRAYSRAALFLVNTVFTAILLNSFYLNSNLSSDDVKRNFISCLA